MDILLVPRCISFPPCPFCTEFLCFYTPPQFFQMFCSLQNLHNRFHHRLPGRISIPERLSIIAIILFSSIRSENFESCPSSVQELESVELKLATTFSTHSVNCKTFFATPFSNLKGNQSST